MIEAGWAEIEAALGPQGLSFVRAGLLLALGLLLTRFLGGALQRTLEGRASAQLVMLVRRLVHYAVLLLTAVLVLRHLGFDLGVLLGAAGVLTVAIGFASQTTASNLISGLFLMAEQSFVVGDAIQVGQTNGEVLSIDMLSVKLRTFDNLYVRIPNENLLKSEIINLTRHPIRRVDVPLFVPYEASLEDVRKILLEVAHEDPRCLEEPAPQVAFLGFQESSMQLRFSIWTATANVVEMRTRMPEVVQRALRDANFHPPYPRRVIELVQPAPLAARSPEQEHVQDPVAAQRQQDAEAQKPKRA